MEYMIEKMLEAKIALCKMISQFMYERTDEIGIEYFFPPYAEANK